jgi:hypothetical protein
MAAIDKMMTKRCSTKRAPAADAHLHVGAPAAYLNGLRCTPLDPNTPDSMRESVTDVPFRALYTLVDGTHDIREGDRLVVDSIEYPIHQVQRFDWRGGEYRLLMLEDVSAKG